MNESHACFCQVSRVCPKFSNLDSHANDPCIPREICSQNFLFLHSFLSPDQASENLRRLWLSEILCWKGFLANFDAAGQAFPDFPAARKATPAKVWRLSGKENGCLKIGPSPSGALLDFSSETATTFLSFSEIGMSMQGLRWVADVVTMSQKACRGGCLEIMSPFSCGRILSQSYSP